MDESTPRGRFLGALWGIDDCADIASEALERDVLRRLLEFGSETPNNLHVVAGTSLLSGRGHWEPRIALGLKGSGLRVFTVLARAVGTAIPAQLLEGYPDLTQEEWDTALAVSGVIFRALEAPSEADTEEAYEQWSEARSRVRAALRALADTDASALSDEEVSQLATELRCALGDFSGGCVIRGEEPRLAVEMLGVSRERQSWGSDIGLCLQDYDVRLAELIAEADGSEVPRQVGELPPGVTQGGWEVVTGLARLVMVALETEPVLP